MRILCPGILVKCLKTQNYHARVERFVKARKAFTVDEFRASFMQAALFEATRGSAFKYLSAIFGEHFSISF